MRLFLLCVILICTGCQSASTSSPKGFTQEDLKRAAEAFNVQNTNVKYCPVDGKHYSGRLEFCPEHKDVKLILIE